MNKLKICVYAITKNEEKFVERWVSSMSEADLIVVLDTGSKDNTVELLKSLGVIVYKKKLSLGVLIRQETCHCLMYLVMLMYAFVPI